MISGFLTLHMKNDEGKEESKEINFFFLFWLLADKERWMMMMDDDGW